MRKSIVRGFRKTVRAIARRVQVDHVAKALTIGDWSVPFEWLLDHDALALDVNSQRGCVICPDIAAGLNIESVESTSNDEMDQLSISWRSGNGLDVVPAPPGSIPCSAPIKSIVDVPEVGRQTAAAACNLLPRIEVDREHFSPVLDTKYQTVWTRSTFNSLRQQQPSSSSTLSGSGECCGVPEEALIQDFNRDIKSGRCRVAETVERYGFAVVEDELLRRCDATTSTELVQKRCDSAEKIITDTYSLLRNSHYGAMSTWSDSDSWKEVGLTTAHGESSGAQGAAASVASASSFRESPPHLDGAYLSSLLDLHTDCTYFVDCPKVQAFGCIFTTPQTFGGETTLSDGFYAARQLLKEDPASFELLTRVLVGGRYKKEGHWYEGHRPVISLSPRGPFIQQITFNNSDRIPLDASSLAFDEVKLFYKAYYKFHELVHENSIQFLLKPGQLLFFDNHRALHGRLQFCGPRVMCGAYISTDEYYSALRTARSSRLR